MDCTVSFHKPKRARYQSSGNCHWLTFDSGPDTQDMALFTDPRRCAAMAIAFREPEAVLTALEFMDENCCHECGKYIAGEFHGDSDWCHDCHFDQALRHAELREAAADDRAHARRESLADSRAWAALTHGGPDA